MNMNEDTKQLDGTPATEPGKLVIKMSVGRPISIDTKLWATIATYRNDYDDGISSDEEHVLYNSKSRSYVIYAIRHGWGTDDNGTVEWSRHAGKIVEVVETRHGISVTQTAYQVDQAVKKVAFDLGLSDEVAQVILSQLPPEEV